MKSKAPYTVHKSCLATLRNNERLRNMKLLQLISDNFAADDYYITFHYSKNQCCDSEAVAKKIFRKYIRRLKALYSAYNQPFMYVKTTRTGKRGGITHYMIINADVPAKEITALWSFSESAPTVKRFSTCNNAEILTAFSSAENELHKRAYTGSRNLKR